MTLFEWKKSAIWICVANWSFDALAIALEYENQKMTLDSLFWVKNKTIKGLKVWHSAYFFYQTTFTFFVDFKLLYESKKKTPT